MTNTDNNQTTAMSTYGAFALIGMALCYLALIIIYGVFVGPAPSNDIADKIAYLLEHKQLVQFTYIIGYLLFACLLTVVIQAINTRHKSNLITIASMFGFCWIVVLFSAGMMGITSLELLSNLDKAQLTESKVIYYSNLLLVESLGGGIELLGGLWVGLLGVYAWQQKSISNSFAIFSLIKGSIGIATVFTSADILRDLFGLTGVIWFLWLAKTLLTNKKAVK